jgi:predicted lipoprotein with Yx(FWY)xxD motif
MNRTRVSFGIIAVIIAAGIAVIGATSGGAKTTRLTAGPTSSISVKQTSLGKTLVNANGRVLYLFEADKRDHSTLSAAGRAVWPPLTAVTKPAAGVGVTASDITLIKGAGGSRQVAYNGHPLYYFVGDRAAGQVNGQGLKEFGALWYVLSPAGRAVTSAPTTPAPAPSSGSSSGYGSGYSSGY